MKLSGGQQGSTDPTKLGERKCPLNFIFDALVGASERTRRCKLCWTNGRQPAYFASLNGRWNDFAEAVADRGSSNVGGVSATVRPTWRRGSRSGLSHPHQRWEMRDDRPIQSPFARS